MPGREHSESTVMVLEAASSRAMSAVHRAAFATGWSEEALVELMAAPHTLALGTVGGTAGGRSSELTGFILLSVVAEEAEILTLAVAPGFRRRGLANRLLEQAIVTARAGGAAALFLEVSENNGPALGLYQGTGFVETGRRPGYYQSDGGADAVIMKLEFPT